jgi:glycerol-3-phosphate dehydrogenase (NAD(P)+)
VVMGGQAGTFAGLAGIGDLLATCISPLSRNRTVGYKLAQGGTIEEIVAEMNMVAEGVKNARLVVELSQRHGVELPICREVDAVVNEGRTAAEAFRGLQRIKPLSEYEAG